MNQRAKKKNQNKKNCNNNENSNSNNNITTMRSKKSAKNQHNTIDGNQRVCWLYATGKSKAYLGANKRGLTHVVKRLFINTHARTPLHAHTHIHPTFANACKQPLSAFCFLLSGDTHPACAEHHESRSTVSKLSCCCTRTLLSISRSAISNFVCVCVAFLFAAPNNTLLDTHTHTHTHWNTQSKRASAHPPTYLEHNTLQRWL